MQAESVAVIGSGPHAWAQLWALTAVRRLHQVRVYGRTRAHATDFAARAQGELGLSAVADATDAVRDADVVILATRSSTPVIDAADVAPGAHVTALGPKSQASHETPVALLDAAAVLTCDSPDQAAAYPARYLFSSPSLSKNWGCWPVDPGMIHSPCSFMIRGVLSPGFERHQGNR